MTIAESAEALVKRLSKVVQKEQPLEVETAKDILSHPDPDALATFLAVKTMLGSGFMAWEPETIWLELERRNLHLDRDTKDKVLALQTVWLDRSFFWDADVFDKTISVLNDLPLVLDNIEDSDVQHIAWAVVLVQLFLATQNETVPDFDREAQVYTAACLHDQGFVYPPKVLDFALDAMRMYQTNQTHLARKTREAWDALDKKNIDDTTFEETPLGVQLARLAGVQAYVVDRLDACQRLLALPTRHRP